MSTSNWMMTLLGLASAGSVHCIWSTFCMISCYIAGHTLHDKTSHSTLSSSDNLTVLKFRRHLLYSAGDEVMNTLQFTWMTPIHGSKPRPGLESVFLCPNGNTWQGGMTWETGYVYKNLWQTWKQDHMTCELSRPTNRPWRRDWQLPNSVTVAKYGSGF
jgi:hypothetical protein